MGQLDEDETNGLSVFHSDDMQNAILLLNSGKPPLDDITIRKTIIHAIDKKAVIDSNGLEVKPVDEVFPKDAPYCDVDLTPRWDYDLEKAMFLNCPQTTQSTTTQSSNSLALGLGLGLGAACLVFILIAWTYYLRSAKYEAQLKASNDAVQA